MSLQSVLMGLSKHLTAWVTTGLNEAQTSQVIVLPVLHALGYDIWNPYEVLAQGHSGGGSGAYAPDFTVKLEERVCFIVEVKALSNEFSTNDKTQAVNYVNAFGRRWAILTNGKAWNFYDNQLAGLASERLALTVELKDVRAAKYLSKLLARELWAREGAETSLAAAVAEVDREIRKHLELSVVEKKLREELKEGFTADAKGLAKAIELTLEPNERELAQEEFAEIAKRLLGSSSTPEVSTKTIQSVPPVPASAPLLKADVIEVVRQGINLSKTYRRQRQAVEGELEAQLAQQPLDVNGWRDLNAGIAEAMLTLGRRDYLESRGLLNRSRDERRKADGSSYPASGYRELSNGEFVFLHASAATHQQRIRQMLTELGVPRGVLEVSYRGDKYLLP